MVTPLYLCAIDCRLLLLAAAVSYSAAPTHRLLLLLLLLPFCTCTFTSLLTTTTTTTTTTTAALTRRVTGLRNSGDRRTNANDKDKQRPRLVQLRLELYCCCRRCRHRWSVRFLAQLCSFLPKNTVPSPAPALSWVTPATTTTTLLRTTTALETKRQLERSSKSFAPPLVADHCSSPRSPYCLAERALSIRLRTSQPLTAPSPALPPTRL